MAGFVCTLLDLRHCYFIFMIILNYGGVLWDILRRNPGFQDWGFRLAAPRPYIWIVRTIEWIVGALWSVKQALCRLAQLLIRLPYAAAATSAPAPLLLSQQSETETTEEIPEVATLQESSSINIWDEDSLSSALVILKSDFLKKNLPIQCGTALPPNASNSSSPRHYEHNYGISSVNEENNDQHLQFKSFSLLDHVCVNLIDPISLPLLIHMIRRHRQIVDTCYQEMLYQDFMDKSDVINSFLCDVFKSAGLSFNIRTRMDASQFTFKSAKSCVMILKISTAFLYMMWNQLSGATCQSFHEDLKMYFSVCASWPIKNVIEAARSISKMEWSASYHIYHMLILCEATLDVIPAIQHLHSGGPNLSDIIIAEMRHNFKGIFNGVTSFIYNSLIDSGNEITRVSHPATDFLVQSMKLLKDHNSIVQHISRNGDGSSYLGHCLFEVISYWAEKLKEHSELLTEGRKCIFLLNNLSCFTQEIRSILQTLLPDCDHEGIIQKSCEHIGILEFLNSLSNYYTERYFEACWGPVRDCLMLNYGRKPHRLALLAFNSKFICIYDCQRTWVLHTLLKDDMRKKIRAFIAASCNDYLIELWKRSTVKRCKWGGQHKAIEHDRKNTIIKLLAMTEDFFESEHEE